tara:strand:+ start:57 stop:272 length:216 start_codon:yes stop_codon:yes gene_type:complete
MTLYKIKTYKFKVTDKETNRVMKYHFTNEILEDLGINKGSVYDIINNKEKKRKKWSKYNIEKVREPYFITN